MWNVWLRGMDYHKKQKNFWQIPNAFLLLKILAFLIPPESFPNSWCFSWSEYFLWLSSLALSKKEKKKEITGKVSKREQKWDLAFEVFHRMSSLEFFSARIFFLLPASDLSIPSLFFFFCNLTIFWWEFCICICNPGNANIQKRSEQSWNVDLGPPVSTRRHLPVTITASRSREDDSCLLGTLWT